MLIWRPTFYAFSATWHSFLLDLLFGVWSFSCFLSVVSAVVVVVVIHSLCLLVFSPRTVWHVVLQVSRRLCHCSCDSTLKFLDLLDGWEMWVLNVILLDIMFRSSSLNSSVLLFPSFGAHWVFVVVFLFCCCKLSLYGRQRRGNSPMRVCLLHPNVMPSPSPFSSDVKDLVLNAEKSKNFWIEIWNVEKDHNKTVILLKELREGISIKYDLYEELVITVDKITKQCRKIVKPQRKTKPRILD